MGTTASHRERLRKGDGLIEIPTSFGPVGPRYAHADWPLDRKDRADGIEYLDGKAHSVFEAAAVVVFALVGQGREKLMQQITVRAMELDRIEPEPGGSSCRLHESVTNGGEPVVIEGHRRILTFCEGDGRRRHRLPAAILARPDLPTALPRCVRRCLAPRMRELDGDRHV